MPCRQTSPWSTFPSQPSTCSPPSRRPRTEWTSSSGGCRTLFRGIPTPQALVEGTKIFDWPKVVIRLSYLWAWLDCWRLQDFCCPPPSRCWTGGPRRSRTQYTPWRRRTSQSNFSSIWSFFVRESFNEHFFQSRANAFSSSEPNLTSCYRSKVSLQFKLISQFLLKSISWSFRKIGPT